MFKNNFNYKRKYFNLFKIKYIECINIFEIAPKYLLSIKYNNGVSIQFIMNINVCDTI